MISNFRPCGIAPTKVIVGATEVPPRVKFAAVIRSFNALTSIAAFNVPVGVYEPEVSESLFANLKIEFVALELLTSLTLKVEDESPAVLETVVGHFVQVVPSFVYSNSTRLAALANAVLSALVIFKSN